MERYRDFCPALVKEKLVETQKIKISDDSVRKIMIEEGLWNQRRRQKMKVLLIWGRGAWLGEFIPLTDL